MKGDEGPAGTPGVAIKGEKVYAFFSLLHMHIRKYFYAVFNYASYWYIEHCTVGKLYAS